MNWIRVAVGIGDDPKVYALCERLNGRVAEAVGLLVLVLAKLPEHAPDGNLASVPATLVERWAGWEGERGVFDAAFRAVFLTPDGRWEAWEKHNGAAMRDAEAARDRAREYRRRQAEESAARMANGSPNGTAHGTGTYPNGSPLRTDGRTNNTTGRSRALHGKDPPTYVPAQPLAPPFCAECGPGQLATVNGSKRPRRTHLSTCSRFGENA